MSLLGFWMTSKASIPSPMLFPFLTTETDSINASVSSTSSLSAVLRKFTVWVKKSSSRFPFG